MFIKIVIFLILFVLLVYLIRRKEGLTNQYYPIPIDTMNQLNIYTQMTDPANTLYDKKYTSMDESDVLLDIAYFNNATDLIYKFGRIYNHNAPTSNYASVASSNILLTP